jgi:hypothetical protein
VAAYNKAAAITASDTVNFVDQPDAIYVGGAGNVVAVFGDNATLTMAAVAGAILPIKVKRINATNTTATGLFALYTV